MLAKFYLYKLKVLSLTKKICIIIENDTSKWGSSHPYVAAFIVLLVCPVMECRCSLRYAAKIHPLRDSNTNSSSSLPCKFNSLLIIICKSVEAILLQFSFCYFSEIMDHSSIIALYIRCCFITVFPSYLMSGSSEARTEFFSIWLELQSLIYNHNYQSTVVAITFIYFQC